MTPAALIATSEFNIILEEADYHLSGMISLLSSNGTCYESGTIRSSEIDFPSVPKPLMNRPEIVM